MAFPDPDILEAILDTYFAGKNLDEKNPQSSSWMQSLSRAKDKLTGDLPTRRLPIKTDLVTRITDAKTPAKWIELIIHLGNLAQQAQEEKTQKGDSLFCRTLHAMRSYIIYSLKYENSEESSDKSGRLAYLQAIKKRRLQLYGDPDSRDPDEVLGLEKIYYAESDEGVNAKKSEAAYDSKLLELANLGDPHSIDKAKKHKLLDKLFVPDTDYNSDALGGKPLNQNRPLCYQERFHIIFYIEEIKPKTIEEKEKAKDKKQPLKFPAWVRKVKAEKAKDRPDAIADELIDDQEDEDFSEEQQPEEKPVKVVKARSSTAATTKRAASAKDGSSAGSTKRIVVSDDYEPEPQPKRKGSQEKNRKSAPREEAQEDSPPITRKGSQEKVREPVRTEEPEKPREVPRKSIPAAVTEAELERLREAAAAEEENKSEAGTDIAEDEQHEKPGSDQGSQYGSGSPAIFAKRRTSLDLPRKKEDSDDERKSAESDDERRADSPPPSPQRTGSDD